jgi:hypothetical protein
MRSIVQAGFLALVVMTGFTSASAAEPPPLLADALKTFRVEGPRGWSFTQTTDGEGHRRVERYNARKPEFDRWTLLEQDGRPPTEEELQDYREKSSRRSRGGTAPDITDQLDLSTIETVDESTERATYRCRLKPGEAGDATAQFLSATLTLHKASKTIQSFELSAHEPFAPTWGVRIKAMKTLMTYSLPIDGVPSLLQKSVTHLRGSAFFFKSLDADMTVTFTDYERARKPPTAVSTP